MEQFELAQLAKKISNLYIQPWHERDPKLIKAKNSGLDYDGYYGYVINDWIPTQKDRRSLMELFILVGFDLLPFFKLIVQPPPGKKRTPAAA